MDAKQAAERVYTAIKYSDGKEFWIKEEFGELMYRNHELLKKLGVSSEGLDKAVEKARTYGMLGGAKLSGGGGGGIAIVLADEGKESLDFFKEMGFEVRKVSIDYNGAKGLGG